MAVYECPMEGIISNLLTITFKLREEAIKRLVDDGWVVCLRRHVSINGLHDICILLNANKINKSIVEELVEKGQPTYTKNDDLIDYRKYVSYQVGNDDDFIIINTKL